MRLREIQETAEKEEVLHLFRCFTHTHTLPQEGGKLRPRPWNDNEKERKWKWDEKLLNQDAKRGTQKKREGENTNTWNLAQNGQPWKGKGKEKRRQTDTGQDQRRGERTDALEPTYHSETYTYLSTRRTQPTCREENARTHEIRDPWGTSWWRCIHINMQIPLVEAQWPNFTSTLWTA